MPVLTVIAGGEPGRVWRFARGGTVRVGSTNVGEVVLAGDELVGATHCALYWVGDECRLRDLGAGGTWLNGRAVQDEPLRWGDIVQCGTTQLRVEHEEEGAGTSVAVLEDPKAKALAMLRALPGRLYAVLDAAADPEVLQLLRRSGCRYECLYTGWTARVYGGVAPHLVQLKKDGRVLTQLVERGWGNGWCVFLVSDASFDNARRHLKKLTLVRQETSPGRLSIFRWYDPRVLRALLRVCEDNQREFLFGAITAFVMESNEGVLPFVAKRNNY